MYLLLSRKLFGKIPAARNKKILFTAAMVMIWEGFLAWRRCTICPDIYEPHMTDHTRLCKWKDACLSVALIFLVGKASGLNDLNWFRPKLENEKEEGKWRCRNYALKNYGGETEDVGRGGGGGDEEEWEKEIIFFFLDRKFFPWAIKSFQRFVYRGHSALEKKRGDIGLVERRTFLSCCKLKVGEEERILDI